MKPTASTESPSTLFGEMMSITTNHTVEIAPNAMVETSGVLCFGCTLPKILGIPPQRAIESVVRAVGRIVVWVDADAEVNMVMISSRLIGLGKTFGPMKAKMSLALLPRALGPAYACDAVVTTR